MLEVFELSSKFLCSATVFTLSITGVITRHMINDINNTIADFFILALCFVKLGFNARYLINSLFIKLYFINAIIQTGKTNTFVTTDNTDNMFSINFSTPSSNQNALS